MNLIRLTNPLGNNKTTTVDYFTTAQLAVSIGTNEARACQLGCGFCWAQLNDNSQPPFTSFQQCKQYNYSGGDSISAVAIVKGIIEPDKACIMGAQIALCQGVCTGPINWKLNKPIPQVPPSGGCQIYSDALVQNYKLKKGTFSPLCCNQLQNLCSYSGDTDFNPTTQLYVNQNFGTIVAVRVLFSRYKR